MLVTLLVLWVVVVPTLTVAGTYFLSGAGRRVGLRGRDVPMLGAEPLERTLPCVRTRRVHSRSRSSRHHDLARH